MTTQTEALKMTRQLLWRYRHETPIGNQPHMICHEVDEAFERIDEALAQPEQEPVAWTEKVGGIGFKEPMPNTNYKVTATIAPQRKPLTDEQIDGIASKFYPRSYGLDEFARAIEAAHGIKE